MAYAVIANLHPIYGLYAGIVSAIVGSFFLSSRHVVTGPTATVSLIVAGILYGVEADPEIAVIYLGIMTGIFQVLFYFLQLGNLARFVSDAVVLGFVVGSACVIVGGQVMSMVGAPSIRSSYFVIRLYYGVKELLLKPATINQLSIAVGGSTVFLLFALRWIDKRIPSSLLLLLAGALMSWWFHLDQYGVEIVGKIPSAVPSLSLPDTSNLYLVEELFGGALALALFGSVQCVSIGKSIAGLSRETLDENRELLGQGLANVFVGFLNGYPVAASFSRSFLNFNVGASTQLSTLLCGVLIATLTAVGSTIIYYVPLAVLAGIIIVVVIDVIEIEETYTVLTTTLEDRIAFLSTFLGVLLLQLDLAIYLGVAVSLVLYLREATRLDLKEYIVDKNGNLKHITHPSERLEPRVSVIDVNGEAFFGSADQIQDRVRELCENSDSLRVIILRMKNAGNIDITGAAVLRQIAMELRENGKTLMLCGTTPRVREVLEQANVTDVIGEDKILVAQKSLLESTKAALNRAQEHIDDVLEGEIDRDEEDPSLEHTMEDLDASGEEDGDQDPIKDEKHTVDDPMEDPNH